MNQRRWEKRRDSGCASRIRRLCARWRASESTPQDVLTALARRAGDDIEAEAYCCYSGVAADSPQPRTQSARDNAAARRWLGLD